MEFSDYDGPSSVELEQSWESLSSEQQLAIQNLANDASGTFFLAVMFGDLATAQATAEDVVRGAHQIAGLPI